MLNKNFSNNQMEYLFEPVPATQAANLIRNKLPLSRGQFDRLLPEFRQLAFTVSGINAADALQDIRDTVAKLPEGELFPKLQKEIAGKLARYIDADQLSLLDLTDEEREAQQKGLLNRSKFLLRNHGNQAYAQMAHADLEEFGDIFPYWKYQTVGDAHVRDTHRALNGLILPKSHEFWKTHFPPWGFGCRCILVPVTKSEYDEYRQQDEGKPLEDRITLTDEEMQRLTDERKLVRRIGTQVVDVDLRSDTEKGAEHPFIFTPGHLQIPMESLRANYDDATWSSFEKWARSTKVDNKSVWQWLNKGRAKVKAPKSLAAPVAGLFPSSIDGLTMVRSLGGSTGASLMEDKAGRQFVMKRGSSAEHLREEFAADELYQAMGVPVPQMRLYETPGGPVKLAEMIQGESLNTFLKRAKGAERQAVLDKLRQHYLADALLGNWDVAGLELDNIIVDAQGVPWRIDNGGSLRFRAMGSRKTAEQWGAVVSEIESLRDAKLNPSAARLFKGITQDDLQTQLHELLLKRDSILAAAPDALRTVLSQRLDDMAAKLSSFSPAFAKAVKDARVLGFTHLGDRDLVEDTTVLFWEEEDAAGNLVTRAKLKLTPKGSETLVNQFADDFRKVAAASASLMDPYWNTIEMAVKSINHHAKDGAYNAAKVKLMQDMGQKLATLQVTDATQAAMVQHYQQIIQQAQAAMDNKTSMAKVAAYVPPKAPEPRGLVKKTKVEWSEKQQQRGRAKQLNKSIHSMEGYQLGSGDAYMQVIPWNETSAPYAFRGQIELTVKGAASPETLNKAAKLLRDAGVDIARVSPSYQELVYLRKGLELKSPTLKAERDAEWRAIMDGPDDDDSKVTQLKAWVKKRLRGVDLDGPHYRPEGFANSDGDGWRNWTRWDMPRETVEKEMSDYTLTHAPSREMSTIIDSILNGGGQFTPTTERLRTGISLSTGGMSSHTDMTTGGANYLFTRIRKKEMAKREAGFRFKVGNLSRMDSYSFGKDVFGDVRPAGENAHGIDPRTYRALTPAKWKQNASRPSNETLFKWGLNLLDELDWIQTSSAKQRDDILAVFKKHNISKLPDGRAIDDVVK